jgi:pilus assembly protein CpaC
MPNRLPPCVLASALALLLLAVGPAAAQVERPTETVSESIRVPKNKSVAFHLDAPAGKIVMAQSDIAEIVATTDQSFYVRGKAIGSTNLLVYDRGLHLIRVIDVNVGYDAASLQQDIQTALPGEHIGVTPLGGGVLLTGEVSTNNAADRAMALAEQAAPKAVTSTMSIRQAQEIALDVRIVEVDRTALKEFGIDLSAANNSGGIVFSAAQGLIGSATPAGALTLSPNIAGGSLTATLRALEQKGVARTLAKPNLTALSGQDASFLAGGEIPVPVPTGVNGGIGIEYRQYGVQLNFTPTLYPDGLIRLKVAPEVSQLDKADGVTIVGYQVPALTVRRASTTVELRDGQSFAIAGLFQHSFNDSVDQIPGMDKLPILGALFRSTSWQKNETELVIVVTPRLVNSDAPLPPDPTANSQEPSAIDSILQGIVEDQSAAKSNGGKG